MKVAALCNSQSGIPTLEALLNQGVLTRVGIPDPSHEGAVFVQEWCIQRHLPVKLFTKEAFPGLLPGWLEGQDGLAVITFPWKVPDSCLDLLPLGCINFHFARLPDYRGPDPVFWTLKNMENEGWVSVFKMDAEWDNGPMLLAKSFAVYPGETYGIYMAKAAMESAGLIPEILRQWPQDKFIPQEVKKQKYWPRPELKDVSLSFREMSANEIHALVGACNPWNKGAYANLGGMHLRIVETGDAGPAPEGTMPGQILVADRQQGLFAATKDGKAIQVRIIFNDLGYLTGARLCAMGVHNQMQFQ